MFDYYHNSHRREHEGLLFGFHLEMLNLSKTLTQIQMLGLNICEPQDHREVSNTDCGYLVWEIVWAEGL